MNDPDWLRFIGDRGVHTLADAENYIRNGPQAMFARFGHGLRLVERCEDGMAMGMCGLLKRDALPHPDIGYAFLPEFRAQGYALEAAEATLGDARQRLRLGHVLAIVSPDNTASIRLLERLGLNYERPIRLDESLPPAALYVGDLSEPMHAGNAMS
jgi:RimJ/RimL family protein N-acetyltransferase